MLHTPGAYRWMTQEMVAPLQTCGEIRVYIVGGRIHSFVGTTYNEAKEGWEASVNMNLTSLQNMGCVFLDVLLSDVLMSLLAVRNGKGTTTQWIGYFTPMGEMSTHSRKIAGT